MAKRPFDEGEKWVQDAIAEALGKPPDPPSAPDDLPPPLPPVCGAKRDDWSCNRDAGHLTIDSGAVDSPQLHRDRYTTGNGVTVTAEWAD